MANAIWVQITEISLSPGIYSIAGFISYQTTSSAGSRQVRIAYNGHEGKAVELQGNANGYTSIAISDILDLSDKTTTTVVVVQGRQTTSGTISSVTGTIKAVRIK